MVEIMKTHGRYDILKIMKMFKEDVRNHASDHIMIPKNDFEYILDQAIIKLEAEFWASEQ